MEETHNYEDAIRLMRAILLSSTLAQKSDVIIRRKLEGLKDLDWSNPSEFSIDLTAWNYVKKKGYPPQLVFCHPTVLLCFRESSLYYRGLSGLSQKAAKTYIGAIENLELGKPGARLDFSKAITMAKTYNRFISSIINNTPNWNIEDAHRMIIANIGISVDGTARNKVGELGERKLREAVLRWIINNKLLVDPPANLLTPSVLPTHCNLVGEISMKFSSDPDIEFQQYGNPKVVIEIKGGIDPAGALERYGAAKKSFEHAVKKNAQCRNFYVAAVITPEVEKRIQDDRLVNRYYNLIELLENTSALEEFMLEIFHHELRIM